jgi:hypothetical protein
MSSAILVLSRALAQLFGDGDATSSGQRVNQTRGEGVLFRGQGIGTHKMPQRSSTDAPAPDLPPRQGDAGRTPKTDPAAAGDAAHKERDPHGKGPAADAAKEQPKGHPTDDRHRNETAGDQ